MMRRYTLYINGKKADLDGNSLVLFTYTQEEQTNPTIVKNSYSQNVTLPGTPANNDIFGHWRRADFIRTTGSFNPLAKAPFQLFADSGELLESGYAQLTKAERTASGAWSYAVTLYGGLGSFFYQLSFKEDGTQMNLGDLVFPHGSTYAKPNDTTMVLRAQHVQDAMESIGTIGTRTPWGKYLTFVPCINGIPDDFDADKFIAASQYRIIRNVPEDQYPHPDFRATQYHDPFLCKTEGKHTEWELRDLRSYLQRPAVNVAEVLRACNTDDFSFIPTTAVYSLVDKLWMTLSLPKRMTDDDDYDDYAMSGLFAGSPTPAAFIIGLAKILGLVFSVSDKRVRLMTRDEWYAQQEGVLDLRGLVNTKAAITSKPFAFDAKNYVWAYEMREGGYAKEYKDRYGRDYGTQVVNTGYEFGDASKDMFSDLAFKGVAMAAETSPYFFEPSDHVRMPISFGEEVKQQVYPQEGGDPKEVEYVPFAEYPEQATLQWYKSAYPKYNVIEMPQFADTGGKGVDGSCVLLRYEGLVSLPTLGLTTEWHVSDDWPEFIAATNEGNPCWDIREGVWPKLLALPKFTRYASGKSLDFGYPKETQVPWLNVMQYTPIYPQRWQNYIEDRYSADGRVMTCKVDLRRVAALYGVKVGAQMLSRFYWWDGAVWALNKIKDYDLAGNGFTECEFVKVQDTDNYSSLLPNMLLTASRQPVIDTQNRNILTR